MTSMHSQTLGGVGAALAGVFFVFGFAADTVSEGKAFREVIDVVPTMTTESRAVIPSHRYRVALSPEGRAAILKFTEPAYVPSAIDRRHRIEWQIKQTIEELNRSGVAQIRSDQPGAGWEEVVFRNAAPIYSDEGPRIVFEPGGNPILVWLEWISTPGSGPSRVIASRWRPPAGWTDGVSLTDSDAVDISHFSLWAPGPSRFEIIWADGRERHFVNWWRPKREGYLKIFARTFEGNVFGPVVRVTPDPGKYHTGPIATSLGANGTIYALWNQIRQGHPSQLLLSVRAENQWSSPMTIDEERPMTADKGRDSDGDSIEVFTQFDVAEFDEGKAMILWAPAVEESGVVYRIYDRGRLGDTNTLARRGESFNAKAAPDGTVHVAYEEFEEGKWKTIYDRPPFMHRLKLIHQYWNGKNWSQPRQIAGNVFEGTSSVHVDKRGGIHIFFQEAIGEEAAFTHLQFFAPAPQ